MFALFLSSMGRLARPPYWTGLAAVVVLGGGTLFLPGPWKLACLAFAWPKLCLHIKRLHDIGRPSSALITPIVANIFAMVVAAGIAFTAITSGGLITTRSSSDATARYALIAFGVLGVLWIGGNVGYLLWLGLKRGDAGDNIFGPPPPRA